MANINPAMQCTVIGHIASEIKTRTVNGGVSYSIPVVSERNYVDRTGKRPSDYLFYEYYMRDGQKPGVFARDADGSFKWLKIGNLVMLNFEVRAWQRYDNQGNRLSNGMQLQIVPGGITLLASSQKNLQQRNTQPRYTQATDSKPMPKAQPSQPQAEQPTVAGPAPKITVDAPTPKMNEPVETKQTEPVQTAEPQKPKMPQQNTTAPKNMPKMDPNIISDEDLPF